VSSSASKRPEVPGGPRPLAGAILRYGLRSTSCLARSSPYTALACRSRRRKKSPNLLLHLRAISPEARAACVDQSPRGRSQQPGRRVEIEGDRRGRLSVPQEPRLGGEVAKVDKRIVVTEPDLLGEDRRVRCASATRDDRAGVAEDCGAQR
jgi:hypothetical protein